MIDCLIAELVFAEIYMGNFICVMSNERILVSVTDVEI